MIIKMSRTKILSIKAINVIFETMFLVSRRVEDKKSCFLITDIPTHVKLCRLSRFTLGIMVYLVCVCVCVCVFYTQKNVIITSKCIAKCVWQSGQMANIDYDIVRIYATVRCTSL